jgi:hypothetical protein
MPLELPCSFVLNATMVRRHLEGVRSATHLISSLPLALMIKVGERSMERKGKKIWKVVIFAITVRSFATIAMVFQCHTHQAGKKFIKTKLSYFPFVASAIRTHITVKSVTTRDTTLLKKSGYTSITRWLKGKVSRVAFSATLRLIVNGVI